MSIIVTIQYCNNWLHVKHIHYFLINLIANTTLANYVFVEKLAIRLNGANYKTVDLIETTDAALQRLADRCATLVVGIIAKRMCFYIVREKNGK